MRARLVGLTFALLMIGTVALPGSGVLHAESASDETLALPADPAAGLDTLYAELAAAPDAGTARRIEGEIRTAWQAAAGPTTELLLAEAMSAILTRDYPLALDLIDAVIALEPAFAEAWSQRATVLYMQDDFGGALHDLERALALEPRHFGALSDLGTILKTFGRDAEALDVYRRALALNPFLEEAQKAVDDLAITVEGRDI